MVWRLIINLREGQLAVVGTPEFVDFIQRYAAYKPAAFVDLDVAMEYLRTGSDAALGRTPS